MKLLLFLLSLLVVALGIVFTFTIIGAIVGIPMIVIGALLFILSLILPIRL